MKYPILVSAILFASASFAQPQTPPPNREQPQKIQIRCAASLGKATQPLILVNGSPIDPAQMRSIAPEDILSVTVLKDKAATDIYGSKARYGVILVTTKCKDQQPSV